MKSHLKSKSFTNLVASMTDNEEVRFAAVSGELRILCDHFQKKFWFDRCPDELWDAVVDETRKLTGYSPLVEDGEEELAFEM